MKGSNMPQFSDFPGHIYKHLLLVLHSPFRHESSQCLYLSCPFLNDAGYSCFTDSFLECQLMMALSQLCAVISHRRFHAVVLRGIENSGTFLVIWVWALLLCLKHLDSCSMCGCHGGDGGVLIQLSMWLILQIWRHKYEDKEPEIGSCQGMMIVGTLLYRGQW